MTTATESARWRPVIDRLDRQRPDAGKLARLASLAVRVDTRLLRRLRLRFLPAASAVCEADLWWSALVAARGSGAFKWSPGAAEALRAALRELSDVDPAAVRAEVATMHQDASPLMQLEEEVAWLALRGAARSEIEQALGGAVRALADQPEWADDIAAWAMHALPALPADARKTAAAWQLQLATVSRFNASPAMGVPAPSDLLTHVAQGVLIDRGRERLRLVREGDQLAFEVAPDAAESDPTVLTVPKTRPLWIEVSSDDGKRRTPFAIAPAGKTVIHAAGGDVLRNALGEAWLLESARVARLGAASDAELGEAIVRWLAIRVPEEHDEAAWEAVRAEVLGDMERAMARAGGVDVIVVVREGDGAPRDERNATERPLLRDVFETIRRVPAPDPRNITLIEVSEATQDEGWFHVGERAIGRLQLGTSGRLTPDLERRQRRRLQLQVSHAIVRPVLTIATGLGAAALAEARFSRGHTALLIIDGSTTAAVPAPGIRMPVPALAFVEQRDAPPRASYALGAVRFVPLSLNTAAVLVSQERSLIAGQWHERSASSVPFPLAYAGDPDVGWAKDDVAVVLFPPGQPTEEVVTRDDAFIAALQSWLELDGGMPERSLLVARDPDEIHRLVLSLEGARRPSGTNWVFVRSYYGAARSVTPMATEGVLDFVNALGGEQTVAFIDDALRDRLEWRAERYWVASAALRSHPDDLKVTDAALEALLGAGSSTTEPGISFEDVEEHLLRRSSVQVLRSPGGMRSRRAAPAPKHVRVDLSAMRRVPGGKQMPEIEQPENARLAFVTGGSAPARSAWIDRNLASEMRRPIYIDNLLTTVPGAVLGWSPSLVQPEALLALARSMLVPWHAPEGLDAPEELAWRIEGANALFVLDGLGGEATDFQTRLLRAFSERPAGRMLVSTPQVLGWTRELHASVVDLDSQPDPADLVAHRADALEPTPRAWLATLQAWGNDRPVLTAIDLARAAAGSDIPARALLSELDRWLTDGDPEGVANLLPPRRPSPAVRVVTSARGAALALSEGDGERMLGCAHDAVTEAIAVLGLDECKRVLRGEATATETPAALIRIEELYDQLYRLTAVAPAGRILATVDAPLPSNAHEALRGFSGLVAESTSDPLALELPLLATTADAMPWERVLLQAAPFANEGQMLRTALIHRTAPTPGSSTHPPRRDVLAFVGTASQAALVNGAAQYVEREVAQRESKAGAPFWIRPSTDIRSGSLYQQLGAAGLEDRLGWNLHVIAAPLETAFGLQFVRLLPEFAETGTHPGTDDLPFDVEQLVGRVQPPVLFLQDIPTKALASSLQARQRCARLRSLAGMLAPQVPIIVVVPALPPEVAPLVLRSLYEALARPDVPEAMLSAVARARSVIFEHSAEPSTDAFALAADLVMWRSK